MKLFSKLVAKMSNDADARLEALMDAKAKIAAERVAIEQQLSQRDEQREAMLAADEPEKKIIEFDAEQDALIIRHEKIEAQTRFLDDEIAKATQQQTREKWQAVHQRRLAAARQYADDLAKAQQSYLTFCEARTAALEPEFRSIGTPFGAVPIPPAPPLLELFKQQIEALEDYENGRKQVPRPAAQS